MHRSKVREKYHGLPTRGMAQKAIVAGIRDRETRQVRAEVIPNKPRDLAEHDSRKRGYEKSTVYSDAAQSYYRLAEKDFVH